MRWVLLAVVCQVVVLGLTAACGAEESAEMPAVEVTAQTTAETTTEDAPVADPHAQATAGAIVKPAATEAPTVEATPVEDPTVTEVPTAEATEDVPKTELEEMLSAISRTLFATTTEETPRKGYQAIDIKTLEECEAMTPINDILLLPNDLPREERRKLIDGVRKKYADLFERHPGFISTGSGFLTAKGGGDVELTKENGEVGRLVGIIVTVEEVVDQDTIPEDQRIPDCLDGVPIQRQRITESSL